MSDQHPMRLREQIEQVMIGGNHLASALLTGGVRIPACRDWTYAAVLDRYSQPYADMWVAWKAIMDLRDALDLEAPASRPLSETRRLRILRESVEAAEYRGQDGKGPRTGKYYWPIERHVIEQIAEAALKYIVDLREVALSRPQDAETGPDCSICKAAGGPNVKNCAHMVKLASPVSPKTSQETGDPAIQPPKRRDLLQLAIADRDARPWRYYRFEWEDCQKWLEKIADERDAALAHVALSRPLSETETRVNWKQVMKLLPAVGVPITTQMQLGYPFDITSDQLIAVIEAVALSRPQDTETLWQPIETAPKDGTQVWLWWDGERRLAHWHEAVNPPSIGGLFANWLTDDKGSVSVAVKPTLWHPLPASPVSPETSQET